jgi:CRP-like cAMP-binding protein
MTAPVILGTFANHEFLRGLSDRHLMTLASGARPVSAEPGTLLAREGETAKALYLIQSGHVAVEGHRPDGTVVCVQTVGPGEVIGWSWIVPPYRWQLDCRAVDHVHGLALDGEWLRTQCEQDCQLGFYLLKHLLGVIASRLAATRQHALNAPVHYGAPRGPAALHRF